MAYKKRSSSRKRVVSEAGSHPLHGARRGEQFRFVGRKKMYLVVGGGHGADVTMYRDWGGNQSSPVFKASGSGLDKRVVIT